MTWKLIDWDDKTKHFSPDPDNPSENYPCKNLNKKMKSKDLLTNEIFIAKSMELSRNRPLSSASISADFPGASKNIIKRAAAFVRKGDKSIEYQNKSMLLLEPLLMLLKEKNSDIFGYDLQKNPDTNEFMRLAFILPGANKFYEKMKAVVGLDGAHINPVKVILL